MMITLPENNFKAWSDAIKLYLKKKTTTATELDSMIGRLVDLGMVLPHVHHFMSRLRELFGMLKKRSCIKIRGDCLEDLRLMLVFLEKASEGVTLNMIAYRKPTHAYRSDSCPNGLGVQ
eukprot:453313-Ditylum_brightwellii.AAC.1